MMSKSFFTSFFIQSIGFQQLVLQMRQSDGREKRMANLSEAGASDIGGPTFMS